MRTGKYRYRELDYATKVYECGFQENRMFRSELALVATYMRRIQGYKPKELREAMYAWCEKNIDGYRRELYYTAINSAISQACRKDSMLINLRQVDFYQDEMDFISSIKIMDVSNPTAESSFSYDCKKLMFTLLFLMKANMMIHAEKKGCAYVYPGKSFRGGKSKYLELKKLAKLPEKRKINEEIIHTLYENKLVTPIFNGWIELDFMDGIYTLPPEKDKNKEDIVLVVKDYNAVGWYYDYYTGNGKISFCKECGRIFRKKANHQVYCSDECYFQSNRKMTKGRMAANRSGKNI